MEEISNQDIIIYQNKEGNIKLDVHLQDETVWLNRHQIANLFNRDIKTIGKHINNVFEEGELDKNSVVANFATTASDGKTYQVEYYNLDVIISVGYRVKSVQGTQFRIWATKRIHEYIVKGFTMDDERLKQEGGRNRYFEELLQRIRDIRSSERNFYQKITDIYSTSIDYRKDVELTKHFFATVQNKMHYAVHGNTAAELIHNRADAEKPFLGLTNFKGNYITQHDVSIAKNYLSEDELNQLNLIVSMYLDFAELQATNGRPMKMQDWINKLDDFLRISEKELLNNTGSISHKQALNKALLEYEKYRKAEDVKYVSDFDREMKKLKKEVDSK
ncbi:MAG: virulence RhuM family protein [Bacteroidales bacterium]|nr:virulence RhuM family protein [Bacteroidales bacterium]